MDDVGPNVYIYDFVWDSSGGHRPSTSKPNRVRPDGNRRWMRKVYDGIEKESRRDEIIISYSNNIVEKISKLDLSSEVFSTPWWHRISL
jgi:hypothetical protein